MQAANLADVLWRVFAWYGSPHLKTFYEVIFVQIFWPTSSKILSKEMLLGECWWCSGLPAFYSKERQTARKRLFMISLTFSFMTLSMIPFWLYFKKIEHTQVKEEKKKLYIQPFPNLFQFIDWKSDTYQKYCKYLWLKKVLSWNNL